MMLKIRVEASEGSTYPNQINVSTAKCGEYAPIDSKGAFLVSPAPCVHFVGFRDDRYWNAVKAFGRPDFIHRVWDRRSRREIDECDTIVFANGEWDQPYAAHNGDDIREDLTPTKRMSEDIAFLTSPAPIGARS